MLKIYFLLLSVASRFIGRTLISAQSPPSYNDCGGTLEPPAEQYAILTNPGYPTADSDPESKYPSSLNCEWTLEGSDTTLIQLKFWDMSIEPGQGDSNITCDYDYVEVTFARAQTKRLCGFHTPDEVLAGMETLTVNFFSDDSVNYRGFQATFQTQEDFNPCDPDPCYQGATCEIDPDDLSAKCLCLPGTTGEICDADVEECLSEPCQNGGTCSDEAEVNYYECTCTAAWEGINCDSEREPPCIPNPCLNGGTCNLKDEVTAACACGDGYDGETCEIKIGCGNPGIPDLEEHRRFNPGSTIKYSCIKDYFLHGSQNSTCQLNGTWSEEFPECYRNGTLPGGKNAGELSTWSIVMIGLGLTIAIALVIFVTWMICKSPWTRFACGNKALNVKTNTTKQSDGDGSRKRRSLDSPSIRTTSFYTVSDDVSTSTRSYAH